MKDLKFMLNNELHSGFNEIAQVVMVYKHHMEVIVNKTKEEPIEESFDTYSCVLTSVVEGLLRKISLRLGKTQKEWNAKKEEE